MDSKNPPVKLPSELTRLLECHICLDTLKNANICIFCSQPFCRGCIDKWLNKNKKCPNCRCHLSSYDLVKVNTFDQIHEQLNRLLLAEIRNRCDEHPTDQLLLFCSYCEECICARCYLSDPHRNHKDQVDLLEDVYGPYKEKLQSVLLEVETRKMNIAKSMEEIEGNREMLSKMHNDEMEKFKSNMNHIDQLQNDAVSSIIAKKDATTLKTIMKTLESARSFLDEEQVPAGIDRRLQNFSLPGPAVLKFMMGNRRECSAPITVDGFSWMLKVVRGTGVYLKLLGGTSGEYLVTLEDEPAKLKRFELQSFVLLRDDTKIAQASKATADEGLESNAVEVVVRVQQARTFKEKCMHQERYIAMLEAKVLEKGLCD